MRFLPLLLLCLSLRPLYAQEDKLQALDLAVNLGDTAKVKALIPTIRSFKPSGTNTNPLVRAVFTANLEIISLLIDAGASPSALGTIEVPGRCEGDIDTPTHNAFSAAIEMDNADILAILLKKGIPPIPAKSARDGLWVLIDDRFSNDTDYKKNSPAADNPFSLIHYAVQNKAYNCVRYLADKMPLNQKTVLTYWFDEPSAEWMPQVSALPIDLALLNSVFKMVELLLQKGSPPPSPEFIATVIPNNCSNSAFVEIIIKAGAKIDKRNKAGQTALGWTTALLNKGVLITEYGGEMGAYEPPDAETEANLRTLEKLLRQAGAKDLGKKDSYQFWTTGGLFKEPEVKDFGKKNKKNNRQFWMVSDLEYGMFY